VLPKNSRELVLADSLPAHLIPEDDTVQQQDGGGGEPPRDWQKCHDVEEVKRLATEKEASRRRPRELDPDVGEITELVGDTKLDPETVALRFIVNRGERTPEAAAAKGRAVRQRYTSDTDSRESLTTMQLDGHEAPVEVSWGTGTSVSLEYAYSPATRMQDLYATPRADRGLIRPTPRRHVPSAVNN
jgi:hypothetical protein